MARRLMWYQWTWTDGTITYAMNYDATEKRVEENKHGKLLKKIPIYY